MTIANCKIQRILQSQPCFEGYRGVSPRLVIQNASLVMRFGRFEKFRQSVFVISWNFLNHPQIGSIVKLSFTIAYNQMTIKGGCNNDRIEFDTRMGQNFS